MILFRNQYTFNIFAIAKFKKIFLRTVLRSFDTSLFKPVDKKMLRKLISDPFFDVGHHIKGIRLAKIDPLQDLAGAVWLDAPGFKPYNKLIFGEFFDVGWG